MSTYRPHAIQVYPRPADARPSRSSTLCGKLAVCAFIVVCFRYDTHTWIAMRGDSVLAPVNAKAGTYDRLRSSRLACWSGLWYCCWCSREPCSRHHG